MNEKCKYCDYVSKCSRKYEYNSIMCKTHRSFPKIVDKSYEELQQENKQLKKQLKQRDEVIKEAIKKTNEIKDFGFDKIAKKEILGILQKYQGDKYE